MSYNTEITINNFNNIDMAIHGYGSFINVAIIFLYIYVNYIIYI